MTNEEAIYLLRNTGWLAPSLEPIDEAIEMACEALRKAEQPEPKPSKIIEAYSQGFKDGADAVKKLAKQSEPQTQLTAKCLECNNSKACKENHWDGCRYEPLGYEVTAVVGTMKDEPQTMYYPQVDGITPSVIQKVGYATDSVTGEILGMTLDTDCAWK